MEFDFNFAGLTSRKKIVVVLALLTGILHFLYGVLGLFPRANFLDLIFILNMFGNLFFVTILYFVPDLDEYTEYIRWAFIAFTVSSIISFFVVYGSMRAALFPAGIFDKLLEVVLIVFLLLDRPLEDHEVHDKAVHDAKPEKVHTTS